MVNLYQMRRLIREQMKIQWRIEREFAKATKITTVITGMPGSGNALSDKTGDGAVRMADLDTAYQETRSELARMRSELDPLITTLPNADDRAVMRLRYINGYSPEDIADAIHRTDRSVYYYLSRAEDQLVKKYPDRVKSNG